MEDTQINMKELVTKWDNTLQHIIKTANHSLTNSEMVLEAMKFFTHQETMNLVFINEMRLDKAISMLADISMAKARSNSGIEVA